ncbi:aKG-HExxH-type peptide beta-hydroxylase [Streptosporangium sp. KLBMP 9127]|nr:HEXXH motif-containing putative peptide modification protein [Streptosporangium sp. KLBMP 9127]
MTPSPHTLPAGLFRDLSRGGGGAEAVHALAAVERSKHLLLLHGLMAESARLGGPAAEAAEVGYDHVRRLGRAAPRAAEHVVRYPAVGLWALTTLRSLRAGDLAGARPERMAALALAICVHAREDLTLTLFSERGRVTVPSVGGLWLPGAPDRTPVAVRAREGRVEVAGDAPGRRAWRGVRRWRFGPGPGQWRVALDDVDPYRFPREAGRRPRLDRAELARLRDRLDAGWGILAEGHAEAAEEVRAAVTMLTPIMPKVSGGASASAGAAFGCVALSTPGDAAVAAVTLVHETQHLKLNALMTMFDLAEPAPGELYYAPWRPDPRPFTALFHGAYAHLGVTAFWRRRLGHDPAAAARFALWRRVTLDAVRRLLAAGRFTHTGRLFAQGMLEVLEDWGGEPVPAEARSWARATAERHRARWLARHA